jgi:hypothetical protein
VQGYGRRVDRRLAAGALVAGLAALGACRAPTVRIHADPHVGDRARYRYEIDATVTRALEGAKATTTAVTTTLLVDQKVVALTDDGVEADVTLHRDGAAARTARVVLDNTGAIRGIELVAGLTSDGLGLAQLGSLLPPTMAPPAVPMAPGERWSISKGSLDGHGRLLRLGVVDGADVAVVRTTLSDVVDDSVTGGASAARLTGRLRSTSTITYDLEDGSARRSAARSRGTVRARIEPPAGIDAAPVRGTISYDIRVRATRLD